MKPWLERLIRPAVSTMSPYASARSLAAPGENEILLDANESPWPGFGVRSNRYPEPKPGKLVARLARLYGVAAERLFLGRGSDEAIDCLLRCFCQSGESSVVTPSPSYGVYETAARIQGARLLRSELDEAAGFPVEADRILAAVEADTRLVFLCSPNNPTGRSVPSTVVRVICEGLSGRALVVLDEAYVEFSDAPSLASEAGTIENLVVLRTLSKAWGLAGLRLGAAAADAEIVALLDRVRAPYPLAEPVIAAGVEALSDERGMLERVARIRGERERLLAAFSRSDSVETAFPSDANFLLLRLKSLSGGAAAERLRRKGVVVRARDPFLRISVGSPEENDRLLEAFERIGEDGCAK
ncbi:MAG: histidinol-phosphate transaminase [Elusimicrobia bacterium CG_4_9_14_3_um_filter_62_55]|nr:MAG: histidinol-phosphate transaminase [Elusimicrobia bacterium CG22_combo_CG10-13_8_21_14_all_63_91]PJA14580.1 MAG: histidinol-phosphate transaminase [Elusimicrobia bacterium CG_4_10_14_0_2_um_filter_63_34]PJB26838.1 MAG: histidinol-phosphate transaminase [Elusimicrobia bacterium CG_4_9_14_3_um_filter_62_55]